MCDGVSGRRPWSWCLCCQFHGIPTNSYVYCMTHISCVVTALKSRVACVNGDVCVELLTGSLTLDLTQVNVPGTSQPSLLARFAQSSFLVSLALYPPPKMKECKKEDRINHKTTLSAKSKSRTHSIIISVWLCLHLLLSRLYLSSSF